MQLRSIWEQTVYRWASQCFLSVSPPWLVLFFSCRYGSGFVFSVLRLFRLVFLGSLSDAFGFWFLQLVWFHGLQKEWVYLAFVACSWTFGLLSSRRLYTSCISLYMLFIFGGNRCFFNGPTWRVTNNKTHRAKWVSSLPMAQCISTSEMLLIPTSSKACFVVVLCVICCVLDFLVAFFHTDSQTSMDINGYPIRWHRCQDQHLILWGQYLGGRKWIQIPCPGGLTASQLGEDGYLMLEKISSHLYRRFVRITSIYKLN